MELVSVTLSRAIFLFDLDSLNPFGKMSAAEVTAEMIKRYQFAQSPQALPEITMEKGAEFLSGRFGEVVIDKLTMYPNGLVVDTRQSTEESEMVAQDILDAARDQLGSVVSVGRKHFVSQVTFRSDMKLAAINPVVSEISVQVADFLRLGLKQEFTVEPAAIIINIDTSKTRVTPGKFTIERRADTPFEEKLYFSSAPLHTPTHLELIEKFEKSLA